MNRESFFLPIALIVCISNSVITQAQDVHHSQFDRVPLTINPALTGAIYTTQVNLAYRTQWSSVNTPFKSYGFSFDQRISDKPGKSGFFALGLNVFKDNEGNTSQGTLNASFNASGQVRISRTSSLTLGINSGLIQRSFNSSSLKWGSQFNGVSYDPTIIQGENSSFIASKTLFDAGAGIVYKLDHSQSHYVTDNHDKIIVTGISIWHLNNPNFSFISGKEKLPMRMNLHLNSIFSLANSNWAIGPGLLFQKQGTASELLIGSKFRYSVKQASKTTGFNQEQLLSLNIFYRLKDALIVAIEYAHSNYSISLSYDFNVSKLTPFSNARGAFEVSLRYSVK